MKSWHSLNQQLKIWRQKYQRQYRLLKNSYQNSSDKSRLSADGGYKGAKNRLKPAVAPQAQQPLTKQPNSAVPRLGDELRPTRSKKSQLLWSQQSFSHQRFQKIRFCDSIVMLFLAVILLTGVVGYRFYNQPQLTVGKISPVTIKAPKSSSFEDLKTTFEKRKEVQTGIVPILKQNEIITLEITNQLTQYLTAIDNLRSLNQPFPFVDTQIISFEVQQYLRSCSVAEFNLVLSSAITGNDFVNLANEKELKEDGHFNLKTQKAIAQLQAYKQKVGDRDFQALLVKIKTAHTRYAQAGKILQQKPIGDFKAEEIANLLNLNDATWNQTKNTLKSATGKILTQGIAPGTPTDILEQAVHLQIGNELPTTISRWSNNLLLDILRPNLQEDRQATLNLAEKAADAIEPITVSIEKSEIIVSEGDLISQADFVLLDGFGLSRRSINWLGLQVTTALVCLAIAFFLFCQKKIYLTLRYRDYLLLCLLAISAPIITIFQLTYLNLPAIGLLVSSFYHPILAVSHLGLVTGLIFFSNPYIGWEYLLAGSAGGLIIAAIAGKLRSREAISKLGVMVGLIQGGVYLITKLIVSSSAGTIWSAVLPDAIIYGLSGVAWCIVALGISPYLERFFDLVTPIRLAELSNPNLPLLKRLATEAPGTFQHTMFVASLAESAARALNCNVELVRAGTLYHDIGKMHDPLGFIENQMGPNKHDVIDDPWISAEIIKKHVSEGLVMAKKYGLPKAIRDFIPQHQGTLLIAYFYHQAKQKCANEGNLDVLDVLEADFRYEGPTPQSREAAILMLADGCEAALRSLKDITPEQALSTVKKIFKARWQDRQLADSGLKYEELPLIADVFVRVWQQFNHQRIVYPKDSN